MAQTDYTCNKDARIASSGGTEMGSGSSDGLPYGTYSGYKYRSLLGFSINMAGWTSITSALLYVKSSDQIHIGFGSDPTFVVQRITQNWSEGSSSGLSTGNAVIYPGPSVTATHQVQKDAPTTENTWTSVDITSIMRDAMSVGAFYGVRLIGTDNSSNESASAANVGEIYSRESGSGTAYIRVVYETNRAPDVPTVSSPDVANGGLCGSVTPTLNVYVTDPDGNAINNFNWQIDDNADFSSPIQDVYAGAVGASGTTVPVVPAALTRGGTYYFRVRAADVSVWGNFSTTFSFKVASLPTLTVSEPSASGRLARLQYDAGSGWVSPRMLVNWAMACPDGGSQATWRVEVFNDNGSGGLGTSLNDASANDTTSARIIPANLVEGNYYHVRVTAVCSHGLAVVTGPYRVRARWGVVTHRFDMGVAPGSLALTTLDATDGAQGKVVVEYMTTTGAAPASWASTIAAAGLNQFFYYRVWLLIWGASPAVSPTLNQLKITYSTAIITPDKWTLQDPANASGDAGAFVFGTQSLRMKGKGSVHNAYQSIPVVPNTLYILSARIQTLGNPAAQVAFSTGPTSGGVGIGTPTQAADIPFEDPRSRLASTVWNSGANTSIYVRCVVSGPVGSTAWFDAIKVEASSVVTPWSPGYIADAVVLDAGGMQIDAANGGIFRLKGSSDGARDIVELGAHGLKFGGDAEVSSPDAGSLLVPPLEGWGMYGIRAQQWTTGGGTCSLDGSGNFKWTGRLIPIAQGGGPEGPASGYFDINCPTSGTVVGVGGAANRAATAAGIPIAAWEALYAILPKGGSTASVDVTQLRVSGYPNVQTPPPSNWLLLAMRNGDDNVLYVCNGLRLSPGQSTSVPSFFGPQAYTAPIRRVYAANNTWVIPAGLKYIEVECVGGGGGGGGTAAAASGTNNSGGGGGGGGYVKRLIPVGLLAGNYAVVVGGAGGGAGAGANTGGTGGVSTFTGTNAALSAGAGTGGGGMGSTTGNSRAAGGAGGAGSGGDYLQNGDDGGSGAVVGGILSQVSYGGGSGMGGAGTRGASVGNNGPAGATYGGGGGGASSTSADVARPGGAGAQGVVIVTEYY